MQPALLGSEQETSSPEPVPQQSVKNPAKAFLLSLLFPAGGLFYCGKTGRALWTAVPCVAGSGLFYALIQSGAPSGALELAGGLGLRVALALYVFGFLDAFFTAREINDGTELWAPQNPRVAAVLNLLTSGFGYFYLGERVKGLAVALTITALNELADRFLGPSSAEAQLGSETVFLLLAADAWRIAAIQRRASLARAGSLIRRPPREARLSPVIPQALAAAALTAYGGLLFWSSAAPDWSEIDQAKAEFLTLPENLAYSNPTYGIRLELPPGWSFSPLDKDVFARFSSPDKSCWGNLLADSKPMFASGQRLVNSLIGDLRSGAADLDVLDADLAKLAGREGYGVRAYSEETGLVQTLFVIESGASVYALLMFERRESAGECESGMGFIRSRLKIEEQLAR